MSLIKEDDDLIPTDGINLEDLDDKELDKSLKEGENIEEEEDEEGQKPADSSTVKSDKEEKPSQKGENEEEESTSKEDEEEEEEETTENTSTEEKLPPFHEHPRFKQLIKDNKDSQDIIQELNDKITEMSNVNTKTEDEKTPDWFIEIYGEGEATDNAFKVYSKADNEKRKAMKEDIIKELQEVKDGEVKEQDKWDDWVSDKMKELKADGNEFDTEELSKFVIKYPIVDADGNIDFKACLGLMNEKGTKPTSTKKRIVKKKIASSTTDDDDGSTTQEGGMKMHELRNKSFEELAEED